MAICFNCCCCCHFCVQKWKYDNIDRPRNDYGNIVCCNLWTLVNFTIQFCKMRTDSNRVIYAMRHNCFKQGVSRQCNNIVITSDNNSTSNAPSKPWSWPIEKNEWTLIACELLGKLINWSVYVCKRWAELMVDEAIENWFH